MNAKHTPGPWAAHHLVFGRTRNDGYSPVGFVYAPSFPENSAVGRQALADCRLAAAAPELLAVLQEAEARPVITESADWWVRVREVIAKATGEQA